MKHCVIFILIGLLVTSCIHGDYWDLGNGYSYSEKVFVSKMKRELIRWYYFQKSSIMLIMNGISWHIKNLILPHLIMILFGREKK